MATSYISKYPYKPDLSLVRGKYWNGSSWISGYDRPSEELIRREFVGVRTPGFKSLNRRRLPNNPLSAMSSVRTTGTGSMTYRASPSASTYQQWTGPTTWALPHVAGCLTGVTSLPKSAFARAEAMANALSRAKSMDFNAGIAFAERKQTSAMLVNSVNRFVAFAVAVKRGNWKEVNKVLQKTSRMTFEVFGDSKGRYRKDYFYKPTSKSFADAWMELSFGWRPLLNDIHGAATSVARAFERPEFSRVTGRGREGGHGVSAPSYQFGVEAKYSYEWNTIAVCQFYFDVTNAMSQMLSNHGISNPVAVAWDLVPLSFVVDWLLPVGRYLNNLDSTMGLEFKSGYVTALSKLNAKAYVTQEGSYSGASSFTATEKAIYLSRDPLSSFPTNAFPSIRLNDSLFQAASGLALVTQWLAKAAK